MTISASYGAGGSVVGPAVAAKLGVEFLDRPLTAAQTQRVGEAPGEGATEEERTEGFLERVLSSFARMPEAFGPGTLAPSVVTRDETIRHRAEERLTEFRDGPGGVVLGWGGTAILTGAYHVRLDGPREERVRRAMTIEGLDERAARRRLDDTDRVRAAYMRRLYGVDVRDPALYHLTIDSTAIPLDATVDLVAAAATAFFAVRIP